ncbi:MAG: LysR family transcriptional regulator [Myxococcota bacterium]
MKVRWDELRFFLAVAREGTIAGAARALKVNESTVARHLGRLEQALDTRLFERLATGYQPTEPGRQVLARAERMEAEVAGMELDVLSSDSELRGPIHVTVPEHLAAFAAGLMLDFAQRHPDITLHLNSSNLPANLTQRQADVAVRVARDLPSSLISRRIADYTQAVYAAHHYLDAHNGDDPGELLWLGGHNDRADAPPSYIAALAPGVRMSATIDQMDAKVLAARRGMGLVRLPCFIGDVEPELRRLGPLFSGGYAVWLLTHEKLRSTSRVRRFMDHMTTEMRARRDRFEGRSTGLADGS